MEENVVTGLDALHKAGSSAFQLQRIAFVPAQYPDTVPIPEGIEIIRLGQGAEVCGLSKGLGRRCLL